jgi:hypothetical protein
MWTSFMRVEVHSVIHFLCLEGLPFNCSFSPNTVLDRFNDHRAETRPKKNAAGTFSRFATLDLINRLRNLTISSGPSALWLFAIRLPARQVRTVLLRWSRSTRLGDRRSACWSQYRAVSEGRWGMDLKITTRDWWRRRIAFMTLKGQLRSNP